jgi:elongation factor P
MKADEVNVGEIVNHEGKVCRVIERDIHGHGKVTPTVHMRLKDLESGNIVEPNFKTDDKIEVLQGDTVEMEYSFEEDNFYVFMNTETFEQVRFKKERLGEQSVLLKENAKINVLLVDDKAMSVEFPETVTLKVSMAPEGVKGTDKEVELENGIKVLVPHFVTDTDSIVIKTEDFSYVERVTTKSLDSGDAVPGTGGGDSDGEDED